MNSSGRVFVGEIPIAESNLLLGEDRMKIWEIDFSVDGFDGCFSIDAKGCSDG